MSQNTSLSLYHNWDPATPGHDESAVSHNLEARGYGTEVVVRLTCTVSPEESKAGGHVSVERFEIGGLQLAELIKAHALKLSDTSP